MYPKHTAFETVHGTVCRLAWSAQPIQQRLDDACKLLVCLRLKDFREGAERDLYERIRLALTGTGPLDEDLGTLHTTTGLLNDGAAEAVAHDIVELYRGLFS
jgi:hypothetical protein